MYYILLGAGIVTVLTIGGYIYLGISFMGLPHKCENCGKWCSCAICFDCD